MSREYDNTNRGALFVNQKRERENQPHLFGTIDVGGVEYEISAWKQDDYKELSQRGKQKPIYKLQVKPAQSRQPRPAHPTVDDKGNVVPAARRV